ncbi:tRNA (5-methylaminomethyl-2-thiouridine)(34)-methyltransferase MnmD [Flavobacterium sp. MAH-1]|uniref:tRNA (5-methylaminomethyl-2-thiouridine)(34)-methyltransferase MnmD n=1 Tax=Flavobacterium agri TaxID=2743471 RepID=A0A7Y8XYU4_9FLAO|nr:tRNA (5-methylaminomethyl-2-thiouridine)(34)-methyltransferase MnmD [Flavobacterium agri]NUY79422.1 tRNA (5-methylaminomethyl-2-thiouridine)(34)-methyltransferase MnmD [Flavobacterium agri]NYA69447.1 tRNA (5-methylaminomethyl-2-thiouridine)(34)-methyltransferase MnmD [Flavobacterium agri]
MKREIIRTADGSTTIHLPDWGESYHSKHGAIQEAYHVFIKNGLSLFEGKPVSILEIGFGTGLNAFITFLESESKNFKIDYVGVEAYPIEASEVVSMNYVDELKASDHSPTFATMHESDWEIPIAISQNFTLTKRKQFFHEIDDVDQFDLIYFDAFGYRVQPELWSTEIFTKMFTALNQKGVLVTYAARSPIKRAMTEAGFTVEKLAGPPGKREMFRAAKH